MYYLSFVNPSYTKKTPTTLPESLLNLISSHKHLKASGREGKHLPDVSLLRMTHFRSPRPLVLFTRHCSYQGLLNRLSSPTLLFAWTCPTVKLCCLNTCQTGSLKNILMQTVCTEMLLFF